MKTNMKGWWNDVEHTSASDDVMLVAWQRMRELSEKTSEFQVRTKSMEVVGSIPTKKKLKVSHK